MFARTRLKIRYPMSTGWEVIRPLCGAAALGYAFIRGGTGYALRAGGRHRVAVRRP
jgi:hypothetical protein